jgi:hypothetical protein
VRRDPARGVHPAEPIHHVIRVRWDFRCGGHRQAASRDRPALLPVHATLALAAATALGTSAAEARAWTGAAGTWRPGDD